MVFARLLAATLSLSLPSTLSPAGISAATTARVTTPAAVAPAPAATRPHTHRPMLLRLHTDIPPPMQRDRINGDNAVLIRQLVKSRQPLHVVGILIHAVQQDHHRIMLLRVISSRQPDHKRPLHAVNCDLFRGFLGPEGRSKEEWTNDQQRQAHEGTRRQGHPGKLPAFHAIS